ncbi:MAG: Gfo/Idh/MocA family oxidoreductase [Planctomycetia bacterium]|nr:Gfo/Idh/MocA family oxidoreductase [Planctomycetia bacterium]
MPTRHLSSRRDLLAAAGAAAVASMTSAVEAAEEATQPEKILRIGVISAASSGKPQFKNGHTYNFAQGFHPTVNMDFIKRHLSQGQIDLYEKYFRNPNFNFARLPFPDTKITHYYDADPKSAAMFCEAFPGVQVAPSLEKMAEEVDAIWLGDASDEGFDHFDLLAPALARGLPTFCDKPIGGTVAQTKKILEFARKHKAPLMSSSLYRHQWGTEEALRIRDSGESGALEYVIACTAGAWSLPVWHIYGHHPVWLAMTLRGPGVKAVNMVASGNTAHALMTYEDRKPAEIWFGRPDKGSTYSFATAVFAKRTYEWSPAINEHYWLGHHYQIFRMADIFRHMVRTRVEPVPHQEILEVTAVLYAASKSLKEKSRLVELAEVMG